MDISADFGVKAETQNIRFSNGMCQAGCRLFDVSEVGSIAERRRPRLGSGRHVGRRPAFRLITVVSQVLRFCGNLMKNLFKTNVSGV